VIRGAIAIARSPHAAGSAQAALDAGGSAADAVIAGFFAIAGETPGGLLSPVVALVAGGGAGARVLDGRALQPGKGAVRPRGWKTDADVPQGARIGAPRSLGVIALLHAARGRTRLAELAKGGVAAADAANASRRASLLRRIGAAGPSVLRMDDVSNALVAAAGPVAGGLLTVEDLDGALPDDVPARASTIGADATALSVPWDAPLGRLPVADAILACDARGLVAAMVYVPTAPEDGVYVPELELVLGAHAHPVRRGIPRTAPGTPLEMPAPIAIVTKSAFSAAIALSGKAMVDVDLLGPFAEGWPAERALEELRAQTSALSAMAVLRDGRDARGLIVGPGSGPGKTLDAPEKEA
jgi:hypothetical protein